MNYVMSYQVLGVAAVFVVAMVLIYVAAYMSSKHDQEYHLRRKHGRHGQDRARHAH